MLTIQHMKGTSLLMGFIVDHLSLTKRIRWTFRLNIDLSSSLASTPILLKKTKTFYTNLIMIFKRGRLFSDESRLITLF